MLYLTSQLVQNIQTWLVFPMEWEIGWQKPNTFSSFLLPLHTHSPPNSSHQIGYAPLPKHLYSPPSPYCLASPLWQQTVATQQQGYSSQQPGSHTSESRGRHGAHTPVSIAHLFSHKLDGSANQSNQADRLLKRATGGVGYGFNMSSLACHHSLYLIGHPLVIMTIILVWLAYGGEDDDRTAVMTNAINQVSISKNCMMPTHTRFLYYMIWSGIWWVITDKRLK